MRPLRETLSPRSLMMIGVPKHLTDKGIEDFDTFGEEKYEAVKELVADYIANLDDNFNDCRGIFFYGSNGTGKSTLASFIIKEAYRRRYTAYRVTFANYIDCYTRSWSSKDLAEKEELEVDLYRYKAAEFLALEEVGKEIESSVTAPILEDLIRYREDRQLPTIICTNLQMKNLRRMYGESVYSLLIGNTTPVKIEGKDQRQDYFNKRIGKELFDEAR